MWSSSDEKVAAVNENGLVTGVGAGAAEICVKLGLVAQQTEITVGQELPPDPQPDQPCDGGED